VQVDKATARPRIEFNGLLHQCRLAAYSVTHYQRWQRPSFQSAHDKQLVKQQAALGVDCTDAREAKIERSGTLKLQDWTMTDERVGS